MSKPRSKLLNRNAFNEKLIHRYLLERYYFDKAMRKRLLPNAHHGKQINLIVPEQHKRGSGYRADLTIYFKDAEAGVPVEVKWRANQLNDDWKHQLKYLLENNGFLVSFQNIPFGDYQGVPHIQIDPEDFKKWVSGRVNDLTRDSLAYQAKVIDSGSDTRHWVVYLRGTAVSDNFPRMLKNHESHPFWAFQNHPEALQNILQMQKGDLCTFILAVDKPANRIHSDEADAFKVVAWYETQIKEPYYMALDGDKSIFFESHDGEQVSINKRRWPHFVDFIILKSAKPDKKDFGPRGEFAVALKWSDNKGAGTPAPLTPDQYERLIKKLYPLSQFVWQPIRRYSRS